MNTKKLRGSNEKIAQAFVNGETNAEGSNLFIEGDVIYSYGHHFPIAVRLSDNSFLFNSDGYSKTTSIHKGRVLRAIGFRKCVKLNNQTLKEVIASGIKTPDALLLVKL